KVHDTFGQIFGAEFTNADESKQVNGIIAIVNKDSKELDQVAYISNAPAKGEEANIHIEMALKYDDYGEFDDGVTVPDEIYEKESYFLKIKGLEILILRFPNLFLLVLLVTWTSFDAHCPDKRLPGLRLMLIVLINFLTVQAFK